MPSLADRMIAVRRDIHAHPEVGWEERRTTALVADQLRAAGLDPEMLPKGTGLVCDVGGEPGGPTVALRADLDALPIPDEKDVPYRSTVAGVAHACGHDVHTAVVLGAGLELAERAAAGRLAGRIRLIFQPAEEKMPGGAEHAIEAGVLDGVDRVFALHCDPRVDAGAVGLRTGPITAAIDLVTVVLRGPGGHTARPQLTSDVVTALAEVVSRTPTILSRRVDPRASLSLVWGRMAAGSAANVIPDHGEAAGTVRVLDLEVWKNLQRILPDIIGEIAAPYRTEVEVDYVPGVPPAVNDRAATDAFRVAAIEALGVGAVHETDQSMGAEDFSWMLAKVPGTLCRLGVRQPGSPHAADLHRGDFDVDESAVECGIKVLVAASRAALVELGTPRL